MTSSAGEVLLFGVAFATLSIRDAFCEEKLSAFLPVDSSAKLSTSMNFYVPYSEREKDRGHWAEEEKRKRKLSKNDNIVSTTEVRRQKEGNW